MEGVPGARVSVAGFPPQYDEGRRLWFFDVDMSFETADEADMRYYPFVRLALARYQPNGLVKGGEDVKLSRVVLTDFVQLAPDRTLTVSAEPNGTSGRVVRKVVVEGVAPVRLNADYETTTMQCSVLRRLGEGDDLDWDEESPPVRMQEVFELGTSRTRWEGTVSFLPDAAERRLVVKELEALSPEVVVSAVPSEVRRDNRDVPVICPGPASCPGYGRLRCRGDGRARRAVPDDGAGDPRPAPDAPIGDRPLAVVNRDRSRGPFDFASRPTPDHRGPHPADRGGAGCRGALRDRGSRPAARH